MKIIPTDAQNTTSQKVGLIFFNLNNNTHGCAQKCPFCVWRKLNFDCYMCPTINEIDTYIHQVIPTLTHISLTGGGDPLYNYLENKDTILSIIHYLKENNIDIDITSHEYNYINDYYKTDFADVDSWGLNVETIDPQIKGLITSLIKGGKRVRISKVFNYNGVVNHDFLAQYINYYGDIQGLSIVLRENFYEPLPNFNEEKQWVQSFNKSNVKLNKKHFTHSVLINNTVWNSDFFTDCMNYELLHDEKILSYDIKDLIPFAEVKQIIKENK